MVKKIKEKVEENIEEPKENLQEAKQKYEQLINEIKPKLLTKDQLKKGGRDIRSRYEKERGFEIVLTEVNELGKKLGYPRIGLGHLRK